jgi:hypothetical protein
MATHVIFKAGQMASKHIDSYLKNVVHPTSDLDNGNVVIVTGLQSGQRDLWTAATPSDVTAQEVFIIDEPVRNLISGLYAIDVVDPREMYVPAGRTCKARKILHGDTCYITALGFSSAPTVGQFAIPANGSLKLAPASSATGAKIIFKVVATESFFVGVETVSGYRLECVAAI